MSLHHTTASNASKLDIPRNTTENDPQLVWDRNVHRDRLFVCSEEVNTFAFSMPGILTPSKDIVHSVVTVVLLLPPRKDLLTMKRIYNLLTTSSHLAEVGEYQRDHCASARSLVESSQVSLILSICKSCNCSEQQQVYIGEGKHAVAGLSSMPTHE